MTSNPDKARRVDVVFREWFGYRAIVVTWQSGVRQTVDQTPDEAVAEALAAEWREYLGIDGG